MKNMKLEDGIKKLEDIVEKLENSDIPLEDSFKLYEEGIKLVKFCQFKLEEVEKKVEILTKNKEGKFTAEPFKEEEEENNDTEKDSLF